jgi:hypothetical protein
MIQATLPLDTECPFGTFTIEEGSIFESFVVEPCCTETQIASLKGYDCPISLDDWRLDTLLLTSLNTTACECAPICTEDDILYDATIKLQKNKDYKSLTIKAIITNGSQSFDLFNRFINFNNFVTTPNGIVQINYLEQIQQFLTAPNRNQLSVNYTGTSTSTDYDVRIIWSLMMNWRYWLPQANALVNFFDSDLPNYGQNQEWVRYLQLSGWNFKLRFELIDDTDTLFNWERKIKIQTYDVSPIITSNIELFDIDDNSLTVLLAGQTIKVKVTHESTTNFTQTNEWAWISVRPFESETNRRISTSWTPTSISLPLKEPISMTFPNATTCIVEALIDVNLLSGSKATIISRINDTNIQEVHKQDFDIIQLPKDAIREDRGTKFCGEPQLVLFDKSDAAYYKNDRTGIAEKFDTMVIELVAPDGTTTEAPGINVNFPNQADAVGFVIDWRQVVNPNCYKVKVNWTKSGLSGWYYFGSFRMLEYTPFNALGTVRLFVVLNDVVRKHGINYTDSGFATTIRFKGQFGYMQPNYETENIIYGNRVRNKVRQEAIRSYELKSNYLLSCVTRQIDEEVLLTANQIYISDHNANNHVQDYYDFPVIISEEESPKFEYTDSVYAKISAVFLDKVAVHESKYDGNIQGSDNVILQLPTPTTGGGGIITVSNSNNTYSVTTNENLVLPDTIYVFTVDGIEQEPLTLPTLSNQTINVVWQ